MLYFSRLIILFVLLASAAGVSAKRGARLVFDDKQDIPAGRLPLYMAVGKLVGSSPNGTFTCTATLVGPKTLLTAAHCYERDAVYWFEDYHARVWMVEGGYAGSVADHKTDIAVLYLQYPISDIAPLKIHRGTVAKNHQLVLAGFGCKAMIFTGYQHSCTGEVRLRENYVLSDLYNDTEGSAQGIHITPGDSGGALVDRQTGAIVGVASRFTMRLRATDTEYELAYFAPVSTTFTEIIVLR